MSEAVSRFAALLQLSDKMLARAERQDLEECVRLQNKGLSLTPSCSWPLFHSGKITRRLLRAIAKGEEITQDVSTLENRAILEQLKQAT